MEDFKRHGARYRARRRAVDILFEAEARDIDPVAIVEDRETLSQNPLNQIAPVAPYTRTIVEGVALQLDDIDDAIEKFLSSDWELDRIPAVDRQILRVGIWEILFNAEVDAPITISNAAELATQYSGAKAAPYIHAVLDGVIQSQSENAPMSQTHAEEPADGQEGEEA
ncbi:transcription antitermination factor NusB [Corynebacterium sp. MC-17D]|uniref:Transcription antitermination protein NusB n=1 Tax=Corynebacterium lipophilum TaxID=2804918 RepID=A0AAW5HUT5_9CORY|nr:transcription antitermination factor NusB [Corynebacterium lipophilum]MCO6393635.1 transcription antitermination factor NusB [Corynebacterium lipophilum]MCZ2117045.1 transcription antitermination factor NusB [Corynebacterium lipophilum]